MGQATFHSPSHIAIFNGEPSVQGAAGGQHFATSRRTQGLASLGRRAAGTKGATTTYSPGRRATDRGAAEADGRPPPEPPASMPSARPRWPAGGWQLIERMRTLLYRIRVLILSSGAGEARRGLRAQRMTLRRRATEGARLPPKRCAVERGNSTTTDVGGSPSPYRRDDQRGERGGGRTRLPFPAPLACCASIDAQRREERCGLLI